MTNTNRRDFLKGTAWMGAVAMAAGCMGKNALKLTGPGTMQGFRTAPLKEIKIGIAGLGGRGSSALHRLCEIPGCTVTAVCDLRQNRVDECNQYLVEHKHPKAKEYVGPEAYKALCESSEVNVVYITTGWQMHAPIGHYALENFKHTFVEVPCALTVEDCWKFVELAEKNRVHAMILENCCYGEAELLCLNLCRQGKFGELVHGEASYIHDLRDKNYNDYSELDHGWKRGYYDHWRLRYNKDHKGNGYPTHGLGPVCQYMNINRGDVMTELVSMESRQANFEAYAAEFYPKYKNIKVEMGDMNTSIIKTALGRTIMLQHDVSSPRPYTRLNLISGTKGIFKGCYFGDNVAGEDYDHPFMQGCGCRFAWERKRGQHITGFFSNEETNKIRAEAMHPYWKSAGEIAKKVGGHGGMDFLMDLRWAYCLQNGLPMDMDVYDLASWSSLVELTETSVREKRYVDIPDFTRGGWKTAKPLGIVDIDVAKFGLAENDVVKDKSQLDIH